MNWTRKIAFITSLLVLVLYFYSCSRPVILELLEGFNRVDPSLDYEPGNFGRTFHAELLIADLHADSVLLGRDLNTQSDRGHADIPRLLLGNVGIQGFGVVTRVPKSVISFEPLNVSECDLDLMTALARYANWPVNTHGSLLARALHQASMLRAFENKSDGKLRILETQQHLQKFLIDRRRNSALIAGFLGLEGAHALQTDLSCGNEVSVNLRNIEVLFNAGFRMIGLVHLFDNVFGGSSDGVAKYGLTGLGKALIKRMGELRMIVDLAHASPALIHDTTVFINTLARPPALAVSHTGVRGTCNNNRNISDDNLIKIIESGGIVGIGFFPRAVCGASVHEIVRAIRYLADLRPDAIEHIALGSDFDGFVTIPFDASGVVKLTDALLLEPVDKRTSGSRGRFSKKQIKSIMGDNVIRFLASALPP
jgi:membrane dipeptidase